jgi:hypothetical protein
VVGLASVVAARAHRGALDVMSPPGTDARRSIGGSDRPDMT